MAQLAEEILSSLDSDQRAVATSVRGPLCVIAGAGTGKTRAITHRLAYAVEIGVVDPSRILALTFTAKAAGEMRTRLRGLGIPAVAARTFHSAALKQLIYFWPEVLGGRFPELLTTKTGFITEAIKRAGISGAKRSSLLREIASEIEWAKVLGIPAEDYPKEAEERSREARHSKNLISLTEIARVYDAYESLKKEERAIDFEDVLLLTVGMLAQERDVRDRVQNQYRYFTVDEYQDVSPLQQRLLDLWVGKRKDICVVGDPAQTIYSFAGATPSFLLNFTNRYPDAEVIRLSSGYRSTPEIIRLGNSILRSAELGHELDSINDHGEVPELIKFSTENEEVAGIVESIKKDIARGINSYDIAVLARTNSQLEKFEDVLDQEGIENQIKNSERFFSRNEVVAIISAIRSASVLSQEGGDWLAELRDVLKPLGESGYVRSFLILASELQGESLSSLRGFLREIEDRAQQNNPPTLPGVALATLHAAKGLEWEKVYLVGCCDGILPWRNEALDEERRLFYVGVTRAKSSLTLSYSGVASVFLNDTGL
jgi:DNA helicase-2/ATP-dependent DNA helicase PcrA